MEPGTFLSSGAIIVKVPALTKFTFYVDQQTKKKAISKYISGGEQFYAEKLNDAIGIVSLKDRGRGSFSSKTTFESLKVGVGAQAMRIWGQETPRQRRVQCKGSRSNLLGVFVEQ